MVWRIYILRGSGYQKNSEPHINYPYGEWRDRLNSSIEIMKAKGYSVFPNTIGNTNEPIESDLNAKQFF